MDDTIASGPELHVYRSETLSLWSDQVDTCAKSSDDRARRVHQLTCPDGAALTIEHVPAVGPPIGACVIGHAMMANRRTLDRPTGHGLGATIAAAGIHTYLLDLRGHGQSVRPHGVGWTYEDLLTYDLPAALSFVKAQHPELPLAGVGHSLVGCALLAYLGRSAAANRDSSVDAVVTLNTNVWAPEQEWTFIRRLGQRVTVEMMAFITRLFGYFPARALRFGSENVAAGFVGDLLRWSRTGHWCSPAGERYRETLRHLRLPVLAVLSCGDRIFCPPSSGQCFHSWLEHAQVDLRVIGPSENGYAPGHMTLVTGPGSAPVWHDVAKWLANTLSCKQPAGEQ